MEMCGDSTSKGATHFDDFCSARKIIVYCTFLKLLLHKRSFNVDLIVGALNDCKLHTPYNVITENMLACTVDEECYTIS